MRTFLGLSVTLLFVGSVSSGLLLGCQGGSGTPGVSDAPANGGSQIPAPGDTGVQTPAPNRSVGFLRQVLPDGNVASYDLKTLEVIIAPATLKAVLRFDRKRGWDPNMDWLDVKTEDSWRGRCLSIREPVDYFVKQREEQEKLDLDSATLTQRIQMVTARSVFDVGHVSAKPTNLLSDQAALDSYESGKKQLSTEWTNAVSVRAARDSDFDDVRVLFRFNSMTALQEVQTDYDFTNLLNPRALQTTTINQFCDLLTGHSAQLAVLGDDSIPLELSESKEGSRPGKRN